MVYILLVLHIHMNNNRKRKKNKIITIEKMIAPDCTFKIQIRPF